MQYKLLIPGLLILIYSCGSDKIENGTKTVYFEGTEKVKQIINYANGYKNGEAKEFYPDGTLKAKQFYANDTLTDTSYMYHPNGKLKSIQVIKNKKANGRWLDFNKEEKVYKEVFFKDGLKDSVWSEYTYRTGKLLTRISYKEGLKHGYEEQYYSNGNPRFKVLYINNNQLNDLHEYYENGKEINNDFKIHVSENNDVLLKNTLSYIVKLEGGRPTDKVYEELSQPNDPRDVGGLTPLKETNGVHVLNFEIPKGGFIMKKVTLVAMRKTDFGNIFLKRTSFNASSNNF